jgi:hypothetical protein
MQFIIKITMAALALTTSTMGQGINCRGSAECITQPGSINDLIASVQSTGLDPNRVYQNGELIVCDGDGITGLCAFLQNTGGIKGSDILGLLDDLENNGCAKCGNVPVFFPSDNNVSDHGELTVNVVAANNCQGVC